MPATHQAAWLDGKGQKLRTGSADTPTPGEGEILVKNHAIAINPVDWKIQDSGYFIKSWPNILGQDVSGEILEVGSGVTSLKKGQRVMMHCNGLATGSAHSGGCQEITLGKATWAVPIPDSMKHEDAVALPLCVSTAAAGLFQEDGLALPFPTASPKSTGKTVLVWGGSSSVGSCVIQLATAAGVDVITTASPKNFKYCEKLGAKKVFDYNSLSIVGDLVAELQKTTFAGAYDTISSQDAQMQTAQVIAQLGGGKLMTVLPPEEAIPATVDAKGVFAISIFQLEVGKAIYQDFLPEALESGQFVPAPEPQVIGNGIESMQAAYDAQKAGVSAKKVVVTI